MEYDEGRGQRIAAARRAAGLTQSELAQRADVDSSSISRYERGVLAPGVDALVSIARVCDVSIAWLASGDGDGPVASEEVTL